MSSVTPRRDPHRWATLRAGWRAAALIARHEIAQRLGDPIMWLLMLALPLAIDALIVLSFGDMVMGRALPEAAVPVAIVNQDRGCRWGRFGEVYERVLLPGSEVPAPFLELVGTDDENLASSATDIRALYRARLLDDPDEARHLVGGGELAAALLIPPDFSEALIAERAGVTVVIDGQRDAQGAAFAGAVEALSNLVSTSEVTVRTTMSVLERQPATRYLLQRGQLHDALSEIAVRAAMPGSSPIAIAHEPVAASRPAIPLTHQMAAAIAVLFIGFAGLLGSASLLKQEAQYTLQRMAVSPTPFGAIVVGVAAGTIVTAMVYATALVGGMALAERVLGARPARVASLDPVGLFLLVIAASAAATGYGLLVAGLCPSYARAANLGRGILVLGALLGGTFFPVSALPPAARTLARGTFHYWAIEGYTTLAHGGGTVELAAHALILVAMALAMGALGTWRLRARLGL